MEDSNIRGREEMSIKSCTRYTAEEARSAANNPIVLLKRIYKLIKESAIEAMTRFSYGLDSATAEGLRMIRDTLSQDGYKVKLLVWSSDEEGQIEITDFTKDRYENIECRITW